MGFDSGSIGFRVFHLSREFTRDVVERFAEHAAPPVESLGREPIQGWVTGRHLLDRDIREEKCVFGPYLHVSLMRAERKLPSALLRAYCRIEEEAERKGRDTDALPRKVRSEIRERVVADLTPKLPPTLSGIPAVLDFRSATLYAGALSDRQLDLFGGFFLQTTGARPQPLLPAAVALRRRQVNADDLEPARFSPDDAVGPPEESDLGMEFLTWLWRDLDRGHGAVRLPDGGPACAAMLEGPLTFFREGEGAHEALLRKGAPLASREAFSAVACGKQLRRARLTVACGEAQYSGVLDAGFAVRGLKLPRGEQFDPSGRLQERMGFIETYWQALLALFDRFLDVRRDRRAWTAAERDIREWVQTRGG
jgi:hypothetical protein